MDSLSQTPQLSLPTGASTTSGVAETFESDPFRGSERVRVRVSVTPGRSNFTPDLNLEYSLAQGNGSFGEGWALTLPDIRRRNSFALPKYDNDDTFSLFGIDDLVAVEDARRSGSWIVQAYQPRSESSFQKVEQWTREPNGEQDGWSDSHWRVVTRDNVTRLYGVSLDAVVCDPSNARHASRWSLEWEFDDRGNVIRYIYKPDRDPILVNTYLKRVLYGNRSPIVLSPDTDPATLPDWDSSQHDCIFEAVFDYGEHEPNRGMGAVVNEAIHREQQQWLKRPDTFSSWRNGFEERTARLCHRILMFHHLEQMPHPLLVRSTDLLYQCTEPTLVSHLVKVTQRGYTLAPSLNSQSEEFDCSGSGITSPIYAICSEPPIDFEYEPFDTRKISLQAIQFTGMRTPDSLMNPDYVLLDVESRGVTDIMNGSANGYEYWRNNGAGEFNGPIPIHPSPRGLAFRDSNLAISDLRGVGYPDLVHIIDGSAGYLPGDSAGGWRTFRPFSGGVPGFKIDNPNLRFLDLTGDGRLSALRTDHDAYRVFYARGEAGFTGPDVRPVHPNVQFRDEAVHLADLTGDGLLDIVLFYVREDDGRRACRYWPNLGFGNFGPAVEMKGTPDFDPSSARVLFSDVRGVGRDDLLLVDSGLLRICVNQSGLSWSAPLEVPNTPEVTPEILVTTADLLRTGRSSVVWSAPGDAPYHTLNFGQENKPGALTRIKNGRGLQVHYTYRPHFDEVPTPQQRLGRLPFVVWVLAHVKREDLLSKTIHRRSFLYQHGHYSAEDREFRGFGHVTRLENDHVAGQEGQAPIRVEQWFHTGAIMEGPNLTPVARLEHWNGDAKAFTLPSPEFPANIPSQEQSHAWRALSGRLYREEVFGNDDNPHPFVVRDLTYEVRRLRPSAGQAPAVFHAFERETLTHHYEREPTDPRVMHTLALKVDDFGQVTHSLELGYPRRPSQRAPLPGQREALLKESQFCWIHRNFPNGALLLGVPSEEKVHAVTGFQVPTDHAVIRADIEATLLTDTVSRELLSLTRHFYQDTNGDPLNHGEVVVPRRVHHIARAAFTTESLDSWNLDAEEPNTLGYRFEDGFWWAWDAHEEYDPQQFHLPVRHVDAVGQVHRWVYDKYSMLPVQLIDPMDNAIVVENDERVMRPRRMTDANGYCSSVAYDPLGRIVGAAYEGRNGEGDTLDGFNANLTLKEVARACTDPEQARELLGRATMRTLHDTWRAFRDGSPAASCVVRRELLGEDAGRVTHELIYHDGSFREIQRKQRVDAEVGTSAGMTWQASGDTIYSHQGTPIERYEPYLSTKPDFDREEQHQHLGVRLIFRYDVLARPVQVNYPNGTLQRTTRMAWGSEEWDANDTILGTAWLEAARNSPDPRLRRAAEQAVRHANTPTRVHLDPFGRVIARDVLLGRDVTLRTCFTLDGAGQLRAVVDPRNLAIERRTYDLLGREISGTNADSGPYRILLNALGNVVRRRDGRGIEVRTVYDRLSRPTQVWVGTRLTELRWYGEAIKKGHERGLRGRLYLQIDAAGVEVYDNYDARGNKLDSTRWWSNSEPDWTDLANASDPEDAFTRASTRLNQHCQRTRWFFDALNRPIGQITPDGARTQHTYNRAGNVIRVQLFRKDAESHEEILTSATYNARGQRLHQALGNGVNREFSYSESTFLLASVKSIRQADHAVLQNLEYTYDPVGNIVEINDHAQPLLFYARQCVTPDRTFEYDALYRLTSATGREHRSMDGPNRRLPTLQQLPVHPSDTPAFRNYRNDYTYDHGGNLLTLTHQADGLRYRRIFTCADDSNQLLHVESAGIRDELLYDANGNLQRANHARELRWDHANRLVEFRDGTVTATYCHSASGERVRKVVTTPGTLVQDWIRLGAYECRKVGVGDAVQQTTALLHLKVGQEQLAIWERNTSTGAATRDLLRYQIDDHLHSSVLELDAEANALSYEEYDPYGATTFVAAGRHLDINLKRYRFNGQLWDEESGFYQFPARPYAPWLCRWISGDPQRLVDGSNRYTYTRNNPVCYQDPSGGATEDATIGGIRTPPPPPKEEEPEKKAAPVAPKALDGILNSATLTQKVDDLKKLDLPSENKPVVVSDASVDLEKKVALKGAEALDSQSTGMKVGIALGNIFNSSNADTPKEQGVKAGSGVAGLLEAAFEVAANQANDLIDKNQLKLSRVISETAKGVGGALSIVAAQDSFQKRGPNDSIGKASDVAAIAAGASDATAVVATGVAVVATMVAATAVTPVALMGAAVAVGSVAAGVAAGAAVAGVFFSVLSLTFSVTEVANDIYSQRPKPLPLRHP